MSSRSWSPLAFLDRPDWRVVIRDGGGLNSDFFAWLTAHVAARLRLRLRAFSEVEG
ncbi:hypothetical protein [Paractinoplanes ferrugineus]|uniref:hypothetical protein n=1 Tax=Paractinoplanes ferrugineus TaxID=113564 RepID=UPI0019407DC1|nr:hypothetical protein [Actinoplanes ferrugineus]